jgi:hypothetical protein
MKSKLILSIHIGLATILFLLSFFIETSSHFGTFAFVFFLSSFGNLLGYKLGSRHKVKTDFRNQKSLLILLILAVILGTVFYTFTEGVLAIFGTFVIIFLFGIFGIIYVLKT